MTIRSYGVGRWQLAVGRSDRRTAGAQRRTANGQLFNTLAFAFVSLLLTACSGTKQKPAEERIPVTVAVAQQKDIPLQIRAIGSVQPLATVAVRALVGGQLMNVWF